MAEGTNGGQQRRAIRAAALRLAQSDLLGRSQFGNQTGLSYGASGVYKRDLFAALGYQRELKVKDYRDRYERGGITERIVEAYPRGTWAGGASVCEDEDPEVHTPFEEAFDALADRLELWSRLMRVDILAGLGRYGALLIGAPGELATELPRMSGPDAVLYLTPVAEDCATINDFDKDPASERFGLPLSYELRLAQGVSRRAHWSRVIHVAEGLLDDDVYGKPRLRAVWNYLDDLAKIVGGGAEAAWKRMDPGLNLDIDPMIEMDQDAQDALQDEVEEYIHGVSRVLKTRGAKLNVLGASVSGFGGNAESVIDLISGTLGIPKRILLGSERGELASTQDKGNWYDRIAERRREFAEPLVRTLVDRLVEHGALPEPEEYQVEWPEIEELSEAEKAQLAASLAAANASQKNAEGTVILTNNEIRDRVWDLEELVEEEPEPEPADTGNLPPQPPEAEVQPGQPATPAPAPAPEESATEPPAAPAAAKAAAAAGQDEELVLRLALAIEREDGPEIARLLGVRSA